MLRVAVAPITIGQPASSEMRAVYSVEEELFECPQDWSVEEPPGRVRSRD